MIAALLKVVDLHIEVEPLTGEPTRVRAPGASPADHTALETALRLAGPGEDVVAVTAAPAQLAESADDVLREALAAGATRAVRLELAPGTPSAQVAAALAPLVAGARYVLCGDASLDRGSGATPAFLAATLGSAQALGLVDAAPDPASEGELLAERRLDGGRRERLRVPAPAVISLEAGVRLRRAPLAAALRARTTAIEVHTPPAGSHGDDNPERLRPYRAPARPVAAPGNADPRERMLALTGMLMPPRARRVVRADPAACADELLDYLAAHGYR